MRITWHSRRSDYDAIILAGDIGGTNSNLALVGSSNGNFELIIEWCTDSQRIGCLLEPIRKGLDAAKEVLGQFEVERCCISGAGPVANDFCQFTNLPWAIDARKIEKATGIPTRIINDFMAISYAVTLLDVNDPTQITQLPHLDGKLPQASGDVHLIVGAGTGLGVGWVVRHGKQILAYPSEGGHAGFASFDAETEALRAYMTRTTNFTSELEQFVSGSGIAGIFKFFRDERKIPLEGVLEQINNAADTDKPALISTHAESNATCAEIMRLFVKLYARACSDFSTILLPGAGIFLAGGIVAKNERFFLEDNHFIRHYAQNFRSSIAALLDTFPVYLIRNYNISLIGAAHAATHLEYPTQR